MRGSRKTAAILLATLATLHTAACTPPAAPPLQQDMYVWQLAWSPAVRSALERTAPSMARLHVLALEIDQDGTVRHPALDADALRALAQPLIAVVRIDGRAGDLPRTQQHIRQLLHDWPGHDLPLQALEIDFDCGTAQLDAYARFLAGLRPLLPRDTRLAITALPAWMASPQLPELTRLADEVVLQVHSVSSPVNGLFDPEQAHAWIERYARLVDTPFRVALPTYGSRVHWDEHGHIAAVVSETQPLLARGTVRELVVDPETVADFLRSLARKPVRGLAGIAWFRMPTDADQRAWSVPTFLAVVRSQPLQRSVGARLERRGGSSDIVIENAGTLDAPAPKSVRLAAACREADAVSGYTLHRTSDSLQWVRTDTALLRAGSVVNIGWARCETGDTTLAIRY